MRWSIQELFYALSFYREHHFWLWLLRFPKNTLQRIKVVFFWTFTGYTMQSLWKLNNYFTKVFIYRLVMFSKMKKFGVPHNEKDEKTWDETIMKLAEDFKIIADEKYIQEIINTKDPIKGKLENSKNEIIKTAIEKQDSHNKKTLETFSKIYFDLWN